MSSDDLAVSIRGLGKSYSIRHQSVDATTAAEAIVERIRHPLRRDARERFWALRNVDLDIRQGQVLGVIGRNGAGKSTLLKLLSRITSPTEGEIQLHGRVGSLLEVGTGFHPELTGRENTYLNGSILGMRRREIANRFEQIVDFAGVERFLDTPVKRYSSGMYVRLAFAVAAHLDTDILLIDEVLAVGDVEFQRKCLEKMNSVANEGRTVVFVSHSVSAIKRLASEVALVEDGRVTAIGPTHQVVDKYLEPEGMTTVERRWPARNSRPNSPIVLRRVAAVTTDDGLASPQMDIRRPFDVVVEYDHRLTEAQDRPWVYLHFRTPDGLTIFATHNYHDPQWRSVVHFSGAVKARCHLPGNFFSEGKVLITVMIGGDHGTYLAEEDAISLEIVDGSSGDGARGQYTGEWPGVLRPILPWTTRTT